MRKIKEIWRDIRGKAKCGDCPLKDKSYPLLFEIKKNVRVMVITEGPNEEACKDFIASIANHPTFTFLYSLFKGRFKPCGENVNVYWTHLRKCFLKIGEKPNQQDYTEDSYKALKICSEAYLLDEIKALKPKLIISVGDKAKNFFSQYITKLRRKKLREAVFKDGGIFYNINITEITFNLIIVPHPSGRNKLWTELPSNAREVIEKISEEIVKYL